MIGKLELLVDGQAQDCTFVPRGTNNSKGAAGFFAVASKDVSSSALCMIT